MTVQPPDTIEAALAEHLDREPEPRYWEPWTPRIGDRVRCIPSPECRVRPASSGHFARLGLWGHENWEVGLVGTVTGRWLAPPSIVAQGHGYVVEFDVPQMIRPPYCYRGNGYAAAELEPVEPAPEARPSSPAEPDGRP